MRTRVAIKSNPVVGVVAAAFLLPAPALSQQQDSPGSVREGMPLTEEERRLQELGRQADELRRERERIKRLLPAPPPLFAGGNAAQFAAAETELVEYLQAVERLAPVERRLRELENRLGTPERFRTPLSRDRVQLRLDELRRRRDSTLALQRQEAGRERAQDLAMTNLNQQLAAIDAELAELREGSREQAPSTIDDFLAGTDGSSGGDFLEQLDRQTAADSTASDSSGRVVRRGDLTGVVGSNDETLIPFRNWTVSEYRDGIARVERVVDTMSCGESGRNYAYFWQVVEIGFVDASGAYLDEPIRMSRSGGGGSKMYIESSPANQTAEERRAYQRQVDRARRQRVIERRQCQLEGERWARDNT